MRLTSISDRRMADLREIPHAQWELELQLTEGDDIFDLRIWLEPTEELDESLLTIAVTPEGLKLNGELLTDAEVASELEQKLAVRDDRTVVIVPDDVVALGRVVTALDIAKASGAESLALLNRIGG